MLLKLLSTVQHCCTHTRGYPRCTNAHALHGHVTSWTRSMTSVALAESSSRVRDGTGVTSEQPPRHTALRTTVSILILNFKLAPHLLRQAIALLYTISGWNQVFRIETKRKSVLPQPVAWAFTFPSHLPAVCTSPWPLWVLSPRDAAALLPQRGAGLAAAATLPLDRGILIVF